MSNNRELERLSAFFDGEISDDVLGDLPIEVEGFSVGRIGLASESRPDDLDPDEGRLPEAQRGEPYIA